MTIEHPADIAPEDFGELMRMLNGHYRGPDLVIADESGLPYLFRWHIIPRDKAGNVYAHLQVASDPARPLHDHPWDNTTDILAGAYHEVVSMWPGDPDRPAMTYKRVKGDVVHRRATWAHRLILPVGIEYALTLFTTGPVVQDWGFWHKGKKLNHRDVTRQIDNRSLWIGPKIEEDAP